MKNLTYRNINSYIIVVHQHGMAHCSKMLHQRNGETPVPGVVFRQVAQAAVSWGRVAQLIGGAHCNDNWGRD